MLENFVTSEAYVVATVECMGQFRSLLVRNVENYSLKLKFGILRDSIF